MNLTGGKKWDGILKNFAKALTLNTFYAVVLAILVQYSHSTAQPRRIPAKRKSTVQTNVEEILHPAGGMKVVVSKKGL
ncbi:MAG: hypothetical protein HQK83_17275 [Fibrobacteria bacterium]|nr:hypothetical protein [Fibrobacteria bacterium]